jgi:hypothetical protein
LGLSRRSDEFHLETIGGVELDDGPEITTTEAVLRQISFEDDGI